MNERALYLTGEGMSLEKMQKFSKMLHLPLWPTKEKPFLSEGTKKQIPPLCVVIGDVSEDRFKEILKCPIEGIVDANATKKSMSDFIESLQIRKFPNALGLLLTGPLVYKYDVAYIFTGALQLRRKF